MWGVFLGCFGGYFLGIFGGVLEIFLWYFGRFLGGKHKGQIQGKKRIKQFIFDELDPYETYSVGVRAKNNEGLSHISNIESFKPNTKKMKLPELVLEEPNNNVEPPKDRNYQFCNK